MKSFKDGGPFFFLLLKASVSFHFMSLNFTDTWYRSNLAQEVHKIPKHSNSQTVKCASTSIFGATAFKNWVLAHSI
jgi:hypothetical protein